MAYEIWYRDGLDGGGDAVEITDRILADSWEIREQAEEGSVPTSVLTFLDPDMDITFEGLRTIYIKETTSESDDFYLFYGYTASPTVGRGRDENFEPLGRAHALSVIDRNGYWQKLVMRSSGSDRSEETDLERIDWLINDSEASGFSDTTTHVDTTGGVQMDAADYRGVYVGQVMADCAEASGRNWWFKVIYDGADNQTTVWYAHDSRNSYDSELALSNEPTDWVDDQLLDGTSTVWPVSEDTETEFDYSRVYSALYGQWDGGATFRANDDTADTYGPRHGVVPLPFVKSVAKARARLDRMLDDFSEPELRVTTTVRLPAAKGTMIRAGMRVSLRLTHVPGLETPKWCRVYTCTVKPVGAGKFYDLTLEMTPTGPPDPGDDGDYTGAVFAGLQRSAGNAADQRGPLYFQNTYDDPQGGWDEVPITGPIEIMDPTAGVEGDNYNGIRVLSPCVLRITCVARYTGVYDAGSAAVLNIYVNGVLEDSDSDAPVGLATGDLVVDIRDRHFDAGDEITVDSAGSNFVGHTGSDDVFWTNSGVNATFLKVGRGTIYSVAMNGVFEGP